MTDLQRLTAPESLDDIAAQLRAWRVAAGSPTFSRIAARVGEIRTERGTHLSKRAPGRVTVYDCFKDGRRRLDVELAVDIARALGVPEQRVAAFKVECSGIQSAPTVVIATSHELPPRTEQFIARDAERAACASATTPVLVTGMPGVGKTTLAAEVLQSLLDDGTIADVVVLSARAAGYPTAVLDALGRAIGVQSESATDIARELGELRTGVLIDDLTQSDQIASLLAAAPSTPVIVTSRLDLSPAFADVVRVAPWTPEETLVMLRSTLGGERMDAEPTAAAALSTLIDGLPLAAELAAARIREQSTWTLQDHLDALQVRIDGLRLEHPVTESIALSYVTLSPPAQRMLRMFAAQPCTELPQGWIGALSGADASETAAALRELIEAHCLALGAGGTLRMHSLIRAYGRSRSWDDDPPSVRETGIRAMADRALAQTWAAVEQLHPGALWRRRVIREDTAPFTTAEASRYLAAALSALTELAAGCTELAPELTVEVAAALSRHLDGTGFYRVALPLHSQAVVSAKRIEDVVGEAHAELDMGQTLVRLGLPDAALHLEWAAQLSERAGAPRVAMAASNALGIIAAQRGDTAMALQRFRDSLTNARKNGITDMIPALTDNIAIMHRQLGDFEGALAHHLESRDEALSRNDRASAASAMANASEVYLLLGLVAEAIDAAEHARAVADELEIPITWAYATSNLGMAVAHTGEEARALELFDEALASARRLGAGVLEASVLNNIGEAHADPAAARDAFHEALTLAERFDLAMERDRATVGLTRLDGTVALSA